MGGENLERATAIGAIGMIHTPFGRFGPVQVGRNRGVGGAELVILFCMVALFPLGRHRPRGKN
ncbi:MAG TPA: hypothetical protein VK857_08530 [Desulforhopalus sp.]|nr:hypothetical protein [Desulforhopalus sp.]